MDAIAENGRWLFSHWTLTFGQPLAILGVFWLGDHLWLDERPAEGMEAGMLLVGMGFFAGMLGTLLAATALPAAAEAGQQPLYGTVNALTLGVGWMCIALVAAGGGLFGTQILTLSSDRGSRVLGSVTTALSLLFLALLPFFPPEHTWTHDRILRGGAIAVGMVLVATGAWLGSRSSNTPSRA